MYPFRWRLLYSEERNWKPMWSHCVARVQCTKRWRRNSTIWILNMELLSKIRSCLRNKLKCIQSSQKVNSPQHDTQPTSHAKPRFLFFLIHQTPDLLWTNTNFFLREYQRKSCEANFRNWTPGTEYNQFTGDMLGASAVYQHWFLDLRAYPKAPMSR